MRTSRNEEVGGMTWAKRTYPDGTIVYAAERGDYRAYAQRDGNRWSYTVRCWEDILVHGMRNTLREAKASAEMDVHIHAIVEATP
jgi:hypothetical protein